MKTIVSVCCIMLFTIQMTHAQWTNSPVPFLTTGDAHIENVNPYLFLNLDALNSTRGGLWFEREDTDKARLTYEEDHTFKLSEINGANINTIFSADLDEPQMSSNSTGFIKFGRPESFHLDFDYNEIQARSGNDSANLFLNYRGGNITLGEDQIFLNSELGYFGINTTSPSAQLHVSGNQILEGEMIFLQGSVRHGKMFSQLDGVERDVSIFSEDKLRIYTDGSFFSAELIVDNDGQVGIGTENPNYQLDVVGNGNFTGELTAASDARFKENISPINNALYIIENLNPVSYHFKTEEFSNMNFSEDKRYGLLAQEVEKMLPELVSKNGVNEYRSLNYIDLIPFLIKSIQELKSEVNDLESRITHLTE